MRTGAQCSAGDTSEPITPSFDSTWLLQQAAVMGLASAILGPLCDGQHSAHGVLHYADPVHLTLLGALTLETCWWVPLLFGAAGVILGVAHPLLDAWLPESRPRWGTDPSWAVVVLGIAVFVLQYAASGILEPQLGHSLGPLPALDALLAGVAWAHWAAFDGTRQGLFMACLTAVAGPAVEVGLINGLHLYHYTHAQAAGIPLWIPWVYFCGAPAVGNLGRRVSAELLRRRASRHGRQQRPRTTT